MVEPNGRGGLAEVKKNQEGSTLVEMIMNMTLLLLFGITIFTLIYSGAGTQERIMRDKDAQSDARIAISYLNVRLRQNDVNGKLSVEPNELTGENSIIIRERTESYAYDTWIFWHGGKLKECLVSADLAPTLAGSFDIVEIDGLDISLDDKSGVITNTVHYQSGENQMSMSQSVRLRSYSGTGGDADA